MGDTISDLEPSVTVEFDVAADDYGRLSRYAASGEDRDSAVWPWRRRLSLFVAGAVVAYEVYQVSTTGFAGVRSDWVPPALFVYALLRSFPSGLGDKRGRFNRRTGLSAVAATPDWVHIKQGGIDAYYRWSEIVKVEWCRGDIFICAAPYQWYIVPVTAFPDVAESRGFFESVMRVKLTGAVAAKVPGYSLADLPMADPGDGIDGVAVGFDQTERDHMQAPANRGGHLLWTLLISAVILGCWAISCSHVPHLLPSITLMPAVVIVAGVALASFVLPVDEKANRLRKAPEPYFLSASRDGLLVRTQNANTYFGRGSLQSVKADGKYVVIVAVSGWNLAVPMRAFGSAREAGQFVELLAGVVG